MNDLHQVDFVLCIKTSVMLPVRKSEVWFTYTAMSMQPSELQTLNSQNVIQKVFIRTYGALCDHITKNVHVLFFPSELKMENAVVVTPQSDMGSSNHHHLVTWVNNLLKTNFKDVQQLGSGDSSVLGELTRPFHCFSLSSRWTCHVPTCTKCVSAATHGVYFCHLVGINDAKNFRTVHKWVLFTQQNK